MENVANWTRSTWTDAAMLAKTVDPKRVPQEAAGKAPHVWFDSLLDAGRQFEAIEFVAHALPRYECAVWAAQALLETGMVDRHDPLIVAVLRWIDEPSDKARRACGELASEADDTPARMLAQAVQLSGGSLAPEEYPPVLPPPDVCAKLAAGAVLSGCYANADPGKAMALALRLGKAMASGQ